MSKTELTLTESAKFLGIKKRTLYNMIEDGRFDVRPVKGINPRVWKVEDLKAWRQLHKNFIQQ